MGVGGWRQAAEGPAVAAGVQSRGSPDRRQKQQPGEKPSANKTQPDLRAQNSLGCRGQQAGQGVSHLTGAGKRSKTGIW